MYVRIETRYTQTAQLDWSEVVTCPHCGGKWKGGVVARGTGTDKTWHGMGAESAIANSGVDAFARAVDAGKLALLRARCPRCHKRGGGVVSLVIKTVLLYGFLGVLFTWVSREMAHGGWWDGGSSRFLLPIAIVLVLVLIPATVLGVLGSVDRRVQAAPVEEFTSQPAPPPAVAAPRRPMRAAAPALAPVPVEEAPPAPVPEAPADPDALELDLDRSWNKRT